MNVRGSDGYFSSFGLGWLPMVLWIGVDDTDSLQGMCTTFLATELVSELTDDYDLIGYPRLVRLNPNIPWKTRGNGAISIRVGKGRGAIQTLGGIRGRPVRSHLRGDSPSDVTEVVERVARCVERLSRFDDPTTNPAFVVLNKPAAPSLYWKAVRGVVGQRTALAAVRGKATIRRYKSGRGVIGACAATAWRPRDRTYEVLTYRHPDRWGTERWIDRDSVIQMDRRFPSTFNNYDYENDRVVIAPHSPCPVLFGIRGDDPSELPAAMATVKGEVPDRWLIFETNQGTDDHVSPHSAPQVGTTVRIHGNVRLSPRVLPGGHVVLRIGDMDATAYEPSKQFRTLVKALGVGDRVQAIGAVRKLPWTLNIEKLNVVSLALVQKKVGNPWCARCLRRAKSMGHERGYRCPGCRARFPTSAGTFVRVERKLEPGWYEPPVGSRRHLSKPLKRMRREEAEALAASSRAGERPRLVRRDLVGLRDLGLGTAARSARRLSRPAP